MRFHHYLIAIIAIGTVGSLLWLTVERRPTEGYSHAARSAAPMVRHSDMAMSTLGLAPSREGGEVAAMTRKPAVVQGGSSVIPLGPLPKLEALLTGIKGQPVSPALVRDGPAQAADLCFPTSITSDDDGAIYVAEPHTTLVRIIAHGQVSTLMPTVRRGRAGQLSPLAFERPAQVSVHRGQLYVLEDVPDLELDFVSVPFVHSRVWKVDLRTKEAVLLELPGRGRRLSSASLMDSNYLWAMSAGSDKGILFLRFHPPSLLQTQSGEKPRQYLGLEGVQSLQAPSRQQITPYFASWGLAVLPDGCVALSNGSAVRVVDGNGLLRVLAGHPSQTGYQDGKGSAARFVEVAGVAWDPHRDALIVADAGNGMIRAVTLGGRVTTIAGGGKAMPYDKAKGRQAQFYLPTDVCVIPGGDILVTDSGYNLIRRIAPDGTVTTVAGRGRMFIIPLSRVSYRSIQ